MRQADNIKLLYIDLFCGAGGTSTGVEKATFHGSKCAKVIACVMRMLRIPELKRIMGFPEDYTLIGTQAEQKKFIGNAVEVNMARVLCEALCKKLNQKKQAV